MSSAFRIDLAIFRGPLDLLLYLVRKHEVEIADLPITPITEQYLAYMEVLRQLDVNAVGDFLEMASTLVEIKSRMVLPHGGEAEEELEDPRKDLVRQLLEYKKFRDAATMLEDHSRGWQERYARVARDSAPRQRDLAEQPIREIELWDLVSAFGRVMREHRAGPSTNIVYDDTPIHVYMGQINERLQHEGRLALSELFESDMHKSKLVGLFLAVLELVRHHAVRAEQNELFGEIYMLPAEAGKEHDFSQAESYEHGP